MTTFYYQTGTPQCFPR